MKKILGCLLIAVFFNILSLSAFCANVIKQNVNKNDAQFSVELKSNPTTGYQWFVKSYDQNLIKLESNQYIPGVPQRVGSGGKNIFTFKMVGKNYPPQTKIMFEYKRPWEKGGERESQVVEINFR